MSRIGAPSTRSSLTRCGPRSVANSTSARSPSTIGPMRCHGVDAVEPQPLPERSFGHLDMERVGGAAPVAGERLDPTRVVRPHQAIDLTGLDPAEIQPVGERDEVAGEAVAADVRALPGGIPTRRRRPLPRGVVHAPRSRDRAGRACRSRRVAHLPGRSRHRGPGGRRRAHPRSARTPGSPSTRRAYRWRST